MRPRARRSRLLRASVGRPTLAARIVRGLWLTVLWGGAILGGATAAALTGLVLLLAASGGLGAVIEGLTRDLPPPEAAFQRELFTSTFIYDRNGTPLYEFWAPEGGRREIVPLREIPPALIAATLATEDAYFYQNPGFDLRAMLRAAYQNLRGQSIVSGGSTITQQLVRNALFDPEERYERSLQRKLREILLAYRLSQRYTKDQILERYLNEIYYGNLAYGAAAAARVYFDKPVQQLTLAEAALLAGLPQAPAQYDPFLNPRAAKQRQLEVLELMVRHRFIDAATAEEAAQAEIRLAPPRSYFRAPHFVLYVRHLLEQKYGTARVSSGGLRVWTTLDLTIQTEAERALQAHLPALRAREARNAALVVLNPATGEILAMVGSADFNDPSISGQINMALTPRQPGSTLMPFTYALAFERRLLMPASLVRDEPVSFSAGRGLPPYQPTNADGRFRGPVTVRQALAQSLNVPAVRTLAQVGVPDLVALLRRLGLTTIDAPQRYGLALTLGAADVRLLDLTFAYATLANGGRQVGAPAPPQPGGPTYGPAAIRRVQDAQGRVLEEYHPPAGEPVLSPQTAWLITDILADAEARQPVYGPGAPLTLSRPAAVKTGTTDHYESAWTIGYTPDFVVGVWVGNADNRPTRQVTGSSGPAPIWQSLMEALHRGRPVRRFEPPPGLVRATVDALTGLRPAPDSPTITDWFVADAVPTAWTPPRWTPTPTPTPTPPPTPTVTPTPTLTPTPTPLPAGLVSVPSVVGLPEAEGRRRIEQAGLQNAPTNYQTVEDVPEAHRAFFLSIPPGHIVSQTPAPGTVLPRGATVYIAVRRP